MIEIEMNEIEEQSMSLSRVDKSLKVFGLHKSTKCGFWLKSKFRFGGNCSC